MRKASVSVIIIVTALIISCSGREISVEYTDLDEIESQESDSIFENIDKDEIEENDVISDSNEMSDIDEFISQGGKGESCYDDGTCDRGHICYKGKCFSDSTFITLWKTDNHNYFSEDDQISLPLVENGIYDFTVRWGDGSEDKITDWKDPALTHTYENPGKYEVRINGIISGWQFCSGDIENMLDCKDSVKLIEIMNWGSFGFGNTEKQFGNCLNLVITAMDVPDLSNTKSLRGAFFNNQKLSSNIKIGDSEKRDAFNKWDVSNITDMSWMFKNAALFNAEINKWNVSNVRDMSDMFDLSNTDLDYFGVYHAFNKNIGDWNVSNVKNMSGMFHRSSFNQDISNWDVSGVTNMKEMFYAATLFNQFIGGWNVSNVTDMGGMFHSATSFNQNIGDWDVSNVTNMRDLFRSARSFNQNIGNWDVSNVTDMSWMFNSARSFNQNIGDWNVSNVIDMSGMFLEASVFNQNIGSWDVSNVTDMGGMFSAASVFNQNIGSWNVSNVREMNYMFNGALCFNQNIGKWDVSNVTNMEAMFYDAQLSTANYDSLLSGWSSLQLRKDINFHAGKSTYCKSEAERDKLIYDLSWQIIDGGKNCK